MKQFFQRARILIAGVLLLSVFVPATAALAASPSDAICAGAGLTVQTGNTNQGCASTNGPTIDSVAAVALNVLSIVVGIIAVIMIIIGGLRYVTSNGDSNATTSARNTILYALVGLVVVFLAQIIVNFVLHRVELPACPAGKTQISRPGDCNQ